MIGKLCGVLLFLSLLFPFPFMARGDGGDVFFELDNSAATFVGSWSTGKSSYCYGDDFRYTKCTGKSTRP